MAGDEKMPGIHQWQQKWDAMKVLCGARTIKDICQTVMPDGYPGNLPGNFKNWFSSSPANPEFLNFFDRAMVFFGCPSVTGQAFIGCSYEQFLDYLPASRRALLRRDRTAANYVTLNVDLDSHEGTVERDWLSRGIVDQRFMYVSREAVDNWNAVVTYHQYPTFEYCKSALRRFLNGTQWKQLVAERAIGAVVILGAGAYQKDILIVNDIIDSEKYDEDHRLKLVIFDSSFYMLIDTVREVEKALKHRKSTGVVDIVPCCADFLKLKDWAHVVRPLDGNQRVAFFILGGTIGNVNESKLIEAVKAVSQKGDIFVIGAEFTPDNEDEYRNYLLKAYDHDAARDLALNPIRNLLDSDEFSPHPSDRRTLVNVSVEDAEHLPGELKSSIPGAIAVVFRTNRPVGQSTGHPQELVLVTSKRYGELELRKALEAKHSFDFREPAFASADAEGYKHLVFERQ